MTELPSQQVDSIAETASQRPLDGRFKPPGPLGFGGAPLGNMFGRVDEDAAIGTLRVAWDEGIRYLILPLCTERACRSTVSDVPSGSIRVTSSSFRQKSAAC